MARRLRIAAVGEVSEDVYLPGGEAFLGGISANFARAALAEGAEALLFAPVGDDARGERVRERVARSGLVARLEPRPGETAEQRVRIDDDGERRFCGWRPGVTAGWTLPPTMLADLAPAQVDLVHVAASPESTALVEQVLGLPGAATRTVIDVSKDSLEGDLSEALGALTPQAAVVFLGGEPGWLPAVTSLSRNQPEVVLVLTAGAQGAWAVRGGQGWHQPTLAQRVVDTTGCGDAFAGAFSVAWLAGRPLTEALLAGARRAAVVAAVRGAAPPPPSP